MEGGPRQPHGVEQRQELGDPQPRLREALLQREEHRREQEQGREEQGEVEAVELHLADAQGEGQPDGGEQETGQGHHRQHPEGLRQRRQPGRSHHQREAQAVDARAGHGPQQLAGDHVHGLYRGGQHGVVHLLENQPHVDVVGHLEARAVHGGHAHQPRRQELDVGSAGHGVDVGAEAHPDGDQVEHRLEEVGQDVPAPGPAVHGRVAPPHGQRVPPGQGHRLSSRLVPVRNRNTSSRSAGRTATARAPIPERRLIRSSNGAGSSR